MAVILADPLADDSDVVAHEVRVEAATVGLGADELVVRNCHRSDGVAVGEDDVADPEDHVANLQGINALCGHTHSQPQTTGHVNHKLGRIQ